MKFLVITVLGEETLVGAAFHDLSVVEHTDLIGILDRTQTVGDGHRGTRLHQTLQGILYQALALGVEGRGGFVEDEDRRILQDGTGDADALALSARESSATIADVRIEALFRLHDEVVGIGNLRCLLDLLLMPSISTSPSCTS